jgi:hypothetical protein
MREMITKKLQNEIGTVGWSLLKPHAERGVLLIIHSQLDLLEVAVQIAEDQTEQVRLWLNDGKITRPSSFRMKEWEAKNSIFTCVIVHPFILVQLLS